MRNKSFKLVVVKEYEVTACHNCPYCKNTAAAHSDAFTSTPSPEFYCTHPSMHKWDRWMPSSRNFNLSKEIREDCPERKSRST